MTTISRSKWWQNDEPEREEEWQFGITVETPDGLGDLWRTAPDYEWILDDAGLIFDGKWHGIPLPDAQPEIYAVVRVSYKTGELQSKDISERFIADIKKRIKPENIKHLKFRNNNKEALNGKK